MSSTEFQQNVGRFQDAAQREPVAITKNGRAHTVLVSSTLFELLAKGRVARFAGELDAEAEAAIAGSRVPRDFDHLDDLIKNWAP